MSCTRHEHVLAAQSTSCTSVDKLLRNVLNSFVPLTTENSFLKKYHKYRIADPNG
ncbi:hypothetical protein DPMN_191644 [Dreissena polymorpha]|uniref:Uncharacterized protein n=1 Tax=Dreissena polymorpha TaxID=45954 RepID=A0A9D4BD41_DREPO|nr:hypothetical protein DPMN_191644 [Dreissena polymorpha]